MDPPRPPPPPRALPVPPLAPPVLLTPEVWEVIAGAVAGEIADDDAVPDPSVRIPAVGAAVRYLPRLHASTSAQLPEYIRCFVHGVLLLADPATHELLAEITLSRHPPQHPLPAPAPAPAADPVHFFSKALSETDVAHNRVLVGIPGNRFFGKFRPKKNLQILDVFGRLYAMKRNSWGLINTGWGVFAEGKGMREGDRVVFLESGGDRLVGLRRSFTPEERALARAQEHDVRDAVDRLEGGEPVTLLFYPGRSESFLEETEAQAQVDLVDSEEDEAHTPPPALVDLVVSEEDEDQTPPPAQVDPVDSGEDDVHSVVIVSSASEAGYAIASFSGGQPVDPDYPAHNMRLSGVAVPRGYRLRGVTFQFSPLRGQRARRSVSSSG